MNKLFNDILIFFLLAFTPSFSALYCFPRAEKGGSILFICKGQHRITPFIQSTNKFWGSALCTTDPSAHGAFGVPDVSINRAEATTGGSNSVRKETGSGFESGFAIYVAAVWPWRRNLTSESVSSCIINSFLAVYHEN